MKRQWTNEELITHFTLSPKELDLIGDSTTDHNLLGAACLLKYFQYEGRFPSQKQDVPLCFDMINVVFLPENCTSGESDTEGAPGMVPLLRKEQAIYAAIRKYSLIPGSIKEVMRRIEGGFLPLISETPGFLAYYALKVRENEVVTISIFDTLAQAQESTPLAFDWVQKYIADLVQGDPEVTVGRVFAVGEGA